MSHIFDKQTDELRQAVYEYTKRFLIASISRKYALQISSIPYGTHKWFNFDETRNNLIRSLVGLKKPRPLNSGVGMARNEYLAEKAYRVISNVALLHIPWGVFNYMRCATHAFLAIGLHSKDIPGMVATYLELAFNNSKLFNDRGFEQIKVSHYIHNRYPGIDLMNYVSYKSAVHESLTLYCSEFILKEIFNFTPMESSLLLITPMIHRKGDTLERLLELLLIDNELRSYIDISKKLGKSVSSVSNLMVYLSPLLVHKAWHKYELSSIGYIFAKSRLSCNAAIMDYEDQQNDKRVIEALRSIVFSTHVDNQSDWL